MSRASAAPLAIVLLVGLLAAGSDEATCPTCYESGFQIDLQPLLGADPPGAVLFSGYHNGRCRDYELCTGSPDSYLGDLSGFVFDFWNSCEDNREVVLFAGGHAPTVLTPAKGTFVLNPTPNDEVTLSIAAWFDDPGTTSTAQEPVSSPRGRLDALLMDANERLHSLGSGVKLDYVLNPLPAAIPPSLPEFLTKADCSVLYAPLAGAGPGTAEEAMQDGSRLNLYFVHGIFWARHGQVCADWNHLTTKPYYIFIDDQLMASPSTVAHELGHAMGMMMYASLPNAKAPQDPGDINELYLDPYLSSDNLMMSGVTYAKQITVGQIYRMHFDERSWLRRGVPAPGTYSRTCQADPVAKRPCPPLTAQPPRSWP
jgi:hypothetical protein